MAAELDDPALLAGLASGDRDLVERFVSRHAPAVIGVAFRLVGDRHLAEDLAQVAFSRAWRGAATYDIRRGDVRSWLLAITRNACIDHLRVHRSVPFDPGLMSALLTDVAPEDSPERSMEAAAEGEQVRRAVAELPEEQRRAVLLATVAGHTAAEVGEIEGIPLGTAKTRIRTGLLRLREAMALEARRDG